MSSNNPPPAKPAGKEETQPSNGRKGSSAAAVRPQEPAMKCPRCDSPNTKFCYYNNYSLTQPRHFCKTCRRYWTKGGALRNVPIGGGCRKNKKLKSSQRLSGDSKDHSNGSSSDVGGMKFFQGLSPAMDFQLAGINIPRLHHSPNPTTLFNHFSPFGDGTTTSVGITSSPCFSLDPVTTSSPYPGFSFPLPGSGQANGFQEMGSMNVNSSLASSIESLSSINQDLHWKLQQQRLAMLFVGDNNQKENNNSSDAFPVDVEKLVQKPQPILFQNLEVSKADSCGKDGNLSTEWFFDNSNYATTTVNQTPATSSSNVNENMNSWSGIQAWNDLTQYTALP